MIYTHPFPTELNTVSFTNTNTSMIFRNTHDVSCRNNMRSIKTQQRAVGTNFNITVRGTYISVVRKNQTQHVLLPSFHLKKWKGHRFVTALLLAAISDHRSGGFVPRDGTLNKKCTVCRNPQPSLQSLGTCQISSHVSWRCSDCVLLPLLCYVRRRITF
jgi:hypothetical protein